MVSNLFHSLFTTVESWLVENINAYTVISVPFIRRSSFFSSDETIADSIQLHYNIYSKAAQ